MLDFNTAGPVRADQHYVIPPLDRLNLRELLALIRKERYFVLHAPRQTGKTSALLALRDLLNTGPEGDYRCVYVNVEPAQTAREVKGGNMGVTRSNHPVGSLPVLTLFLAAGLLPTPQLVAPPDRDPEASASEQDCGTTPLHGRATNRSPLVTAHVLAAGGQTWPHWTPMDIGPCTTLWGWSMTREYRHGRGVGARGLS